MDEGTARTDPGATLRALRMRRGATLKDFSTLTGLPVSTLSKLENGKLGMSYQRLLKLSRSLDVDLTELINGAPAKEGGPRSPLAVAVQPPAVSGRREITRARAGAVVKTQFYDYQYPASDLIRKMLTPMIMDVHARSIDEFDELMRHPGEEYALVLEGSVDFHSDHYKPTRLTEGDSIYFDANMGHAYVAVNEGPCRVLSVCSAPLDELVESRMRIEKAAARPAEQARKETLPGRATKGRRTPALAKSGGRSEAVGSKA